MSPGASSYRKGAAFENGVKAELEDKGYFVIRSAGSKGDFDLVAFRPARAHGLVIEGYPPLGIQCRMNHNLSRQERAYYVDLARTYYLVPVLWSRKGAFVIWLDGNERLDV